MAAVPTAFRLVRLLWRGARAVSAVRRTFEYGQRISRVAQDIANDLGESGAQMTDEELAQELENRGVQYRDQSRRPTARDFLEGPDETRAEHLAGTREFQRQR